MTVQLHDASGPPMRKDAENGRLVSDMRAEHQLWLDEQPTSTSCFFCDWTTEGTAAECREAAREHREKEHPAAQNRVGRRSIRTKMQRRADQTPEDAARVSAERAEANRVRAEREDAERVAKVDAARARGLLISQNEQQPLEDREEEHGTTPHVDPAGPQPAGAPPPRDTTGGLEEAPAAEDAGAGVADASSNSTTPDDEGTPMHENGNSRAKKWPLERAIAAVQAVAEELGRTPTIGQMVAAGYAFAPSCTKLGLPTWSRLCAQAGLEPNRAGGATRSRREPLAAPAVTPAEEDASTRPTEPASRPEHHPLTATIHAEADRLVAQAGVLLDRASTLREHAVAIEEIAA